MGFGLDSLGGAGGGGSTDLSSKSGIGTGGAQSAGVSVPIAISSGAGGRGASFNFARGNIEASQTNKQDGVSAVPNDPLDLGKSSTKTIVWAIAGVGLLAAVIILLPKRK